ncbi:hypothetical protein SDC9_66590 [bioreactor metagenome]|uniref:Transcobalamin-like C-terminal domain-containing protein n=1 Tax=bioreactor metagenome TaxID=1076179 RepID=A0A644XWW7_9ZZZZ
MKITRKILLAAVLFALLLGAFLLNGEMPKRSDIPGKAAMPVTAETEQEPGNEQTAPPLQNNAQGSKPLPAQDPPKEEPAPKADVPKTDPDTSNEVENTEKAYTCTISIRCGTLLDNLDALDTEKRELVPDDGVILSEVEATFYEGESVFDVLRRETKRAKIHMEYVDTPIYNSAYIEGIGNLYEFDCGEGSGWMYEVNGWFPNYGSSRYTLKDGDEVIWVYTCNLGEDVGGGYAGGQQRE